MTDSILQHNFKGNAIFQAEADGMVNLTNIWRAAKTLNDKAGKPTPSIADWLRTESAKSLIEELESEVGYPMTADAKGFQGVLRKVRGGVPQNQGTWGLPEIGIAYAMAAHAGLGIWASRVLLAHIHGTPAPATADPVAAILKAFTLPNPAKWDMRFHPEWRREACALTGWDWKYSCFSGFINRAVYAYLPSDVVDYLRKEAASNGTFMHQSLSPAAVDGLLKPHLAIVMQAMIDSESKEECYELIARRVDRKYQLSLL